MSELDKQITGPEKYALKRLRENISQDVVISFLQAITRISFEDEQEFRYSFPDIFQNVSQSSLYLTIKNRKKSIDKGENPGLFLYKSDFAFLYSDIVKTFKNRLEDFDGLDDYKLLKNIVLFCEENDSDLEITNSADIHLNQVLTKKVVRLAKFILEILETDEDLKIEDEPKDKEEDKEEKEKTEIKTDDVAGGVVSQSQGADSEIEGGTPSDLETSLPASESLATKNILFSKDLRDQAAQFTAIAISQLEQHHGLPPGTLSSSRDLQRALSQKTLGFFLTTIGDGRASDLINPETKILLVREYIWMVQNDFRTTSIISNHLTETLEVNKSPELKEKVEQALVDAEQGTVAGVSKLVTDLAKNPAINQILGVVGQEAVVKDEENYLAREATELLQRELKRVGVHSDKLVLAEKNVTNVVDAWIVQGLPLDMLQHIDEGRFKLIFGDEIPFNEEFLESLEEVWIARRSILGKRTGQLLLHNEARFATQEALTLLDTKKKELTKKESDGVFERAVAAPTRQILVNSKDAPIENPAELVELIHDKKSPTHSQKREIFLKQVWVAKDIEVKKEILAVLGYGESNSKTIQNIAENPDFYPKEIGLHDMAPLLGGAAFYTADQMNDFGSDYIPSNGSLHSPLANVRQLRARTRGLNRKLKRGIKGIRSRLSKKAANKAADKVAEAGMKRAASAAAGTVNPALGFLTKMASTKKGRRTLIAAGAGIGLGLAFMIKAMMKSWITGLSSLGGAILGGVGGFFVGGPVGAVVGAVAGAGAGFGIAEWIQGSGSGGGITATAATSTQGAQAATAAQASQAATAAQATTYNLGVTTFQPTSFMGQSLVHIGGQAVLGTVAAVAGGGMLMHAISSGAMLADFPVVDPLSTLSGSIPGKESEYVSIEKRAFIAGCPENKCENPAFPLKVEYSLKIEPKGNYTIQILDATDTMKVNHSDKAWEENGLGSPPNVPDRVKNLSDFEELYEEMILTPGDSVTISYSETLDSKYNHSSVLNTFDLKVFAKDPETGVEATDNAITGEVVYIGDYSQGAGCWPASGTISQLPGGSWSHGNFDAFDIANSEGTNIFAPFSGEACPANIHPGYGIHLVLKTDVGTLLFGHFRSMNISSCKQVVAGEVLGQMGNTGNSTGPHLHLELRGSSPGSGALPALMPDGASIKVNDPVRTCYE